MDRLFLVCGPTGAGKTTLFDALTFALYERTSGTRGGLTDQLVSHHAPEGSVPEVSLRFSLGTQEWRVTRQLRHRVPKKKGEGWTEREAQVLLEQKNEGGWEALPGKRTEINQKLEDLLGLSAEEFSKIVVLPQGDFQRFLEASTGEREKMLQKLFPVETYDRMVEILKTKAKGLEDARAQWEDRWQTLVSRMGTADDRAVLEARWVQASEEAQRAAQSEEQAVARQLKLKNLHEAWSDLEKKNAASEVLETRRSGIEADRLRLERARRARPLGPDLDRQDAILIEGKRLRTDQDASREALAQAEAEQAGWQARKPEAEAWQARLDQVLQERGLAEHQRELWTEAETLKEGERQAAERESGATKALESARGLVAQAEARLTPPPPGPAWAEALELLEARRQAHAQATEGLRQQQERKVLEGERLAVDQAIAEAERAEREALSELRVWNQILDALKAASLAEGLVDGQPCPVCGSRDHPVRAGWPEAHAEAPIRQKKADDAREQARAQLAEGLARRRTLDERLEALPQLETLPDLALTQREWEEAQNHLQALQAWTQGQEAARKALDDARKALAQADQDHQTALRDRQTWSTRRASLAQTVAEDPRPRIESLRREEAVLRQNLDAHRTQNERLVRTQESHRTTIEALEIQLTHQREEYKRLQTTLDEAVAALGWTLTELRGARLSEQDISGLEAQVSSFDQERHRLDGELSALMVRFPEGAPPPLEPVNHALEEARQARQALETQAKEAEYALRTRDDLEDQLREVSREKDALEAEFQAVVPLARALEGHNGLNLKLTTWVLVQALEQVAASATRRLASMSGGRYALKVQTKGTDARRDWGLDLAVIDGYTGQERGVGTLSGGEKFMTSISLALGLADVIQERSGGLKLEAIFIDEGFGTLDDQSLDRAMAILHDLGQHRWVGIISHVADLRQRITSKVEVVKGQNGSWLRQD